MLAPPQALSPRVSVPRFQTLDWYETPLYYDIVFAPETEVEAEFLEAMAARHGRPRGRRVLEPACGSGRLVLELARRGWRVTGFDASEAMLAFAGEKLRKEGLAARLVPARMESFALRGPFDLAHCLVTTFKYLLDERSARAHLERVAAALAPGGLYVLGFHLTDYAETRRTRERWVERRGRTEVVCNIQAWPADRRRRLERVRSRLAVTEGVPGKQVVRRSETSWSFRTYDAGQVRRLLRSVPALELVATHDFTYDPGSELELGDDQLDVVLILRRR